MANYTIDTNSAIVPYSYGGRRIVRDSNGRLHVIWSQYYLYSDDNGVTWSARYNFAGSEHFGGAGANTKPGSAMAIDSNNNLHIIFTARGANYYSDIFYTKYNGSEWSTPINISNHNSSSFNAQYMSIAVDADDNLHVSYGYDGNIKYIYSSDGITWDTPITIITFGTVYLTNIVSDSNNIIHLIITTGPATGLRHYFKKPGESWSAATMEASYITKGAIAIDSNNDLHLIWTREISNIYYFQYRKFIISTETWGSVEEVADSNTYGWFNSEISIDSNDYIHAIASRKISGGGIPFSLHFVHVLNNGSWQAPEDIFTKLVTSQTGPTVSHAGTISLQVPTAKNNILTQGYCVLSYHGSLSNKNVKIWVSSDAHFIKPPTIKGVQTIQGIQSIQF